MNLRALVRAAARHKVLVGLGIAVGLLVAVSVLYKIDFRERRVSERSFGVYETTVEMMISDSKFAIGRTVPPQGTTDSFQRTIAVAPSYARMVSSDAVVEAAEKQLGPLQVTFDAEALQASPIIKLTVIGSSPTRVTEVARVLSTEFAAYLQKTQDGYDIPKADRIRVQVLSEPAAPTAKQTRRSELAALSFLLSVFAFVAMAFVVDASRTPGGLAFDESFDTPESSGSWG